MVEQKKRIEQIELSATCSSRSTAERAAMRSIVFRARYAAARSRSRYRSCLAKILWYAPRAGCSSPCALSLRRILESSSNNRPFAAERPFSPFTKHSSYHIMIVIEICFGAEPTNVLYGGPRSERERVEAPRQRFSGLSRVRTCAARSARYSGNERFSFCGKKRIQVVPRAFVLMWTEAFIFESDL